MSRPIPPTIHWLWLGPDAVPDLFAHYQDSWRHHHPGWETRLWRDDTLPPLALQQAFDATTAFKVRYDMARLELLRQCGGVIVDLDVEAIRPIDPLIAGVEAFAGGIAGGHIGNQILGAVPHHPFFERAVARLAGSGGNARSSSDRAGKGFLEQLVAESPGELTVFPPATFHFEPASEPPKRPDEFPQVYAVHHQLESYAGAVSDETLEELTSTLARQAARIQRALDALGGVAADARVVTAVSVLERARDRVTRTEQKLRRAFLMQERNLQAQRRQLRAARDQVEVRLARAERMARQRIAELEQQLADARAAVAPSPRAPGRD